jgi:hypothetical protein
MVQRRPGEIFFGERLSPGLTPGLLGAAAKGLLTLLFLR